MGIKVGITGGIGSGKSYVSRIFKAMGVPFYDADKEARSLMNIHPNVRKGLIEAFGPQVYRPDGLLDRRWLAAQVFGDNERIRILNSIVHPIVIQHGEDWARQQIAAYSLKEAALLIESGSYKALDCLILVSAPEEIRIGRVMQRDGISREEVLERIAKQMPEEEKQKYADFVILNNGTTPLLQQVLDIHQQILQREWSR